MAIEYLGEEVFDLKNTQYYDYGPTDWALYFIEQYFYIDGEEHKKWLLDQVARVLNDTEVVVSLASWSNGEKEYRISTGTPSASYRKWVAENMGNDYDAGTT